ncbi:hypothetical protein BGZ83_007165 [Gryganskiella cystojenkinii]|nr:hypothetical protein BGZ83_007165 [Gryganskiella cystojenkinii]
MTARSKTLAAAASAAPAKAPVVKKAKPTAAATGPLKEAPTYKEMIIAALLHLKDRNGSSRQALKKYIAGNYKVGEQSDLHVNVAIKRGVETGDFLQPKGQSGPIKLAKKEPKKKVVKEKKAKKPATKKAAPKKAAVKKDGTKAAPKKATAVKKATKKASEKKSTGEKAKAPKKAAAPKEKKAKSAAPKKAAASKEKKPKAAAKPKAVKA